MLVLSLVASIVISLVSIESSCSLTPAEIQAASTALTALTQNKALTEQFVRDIKTTFEPGDIQYRTVMGLYELSRDDDNNYISTIETSDRSGRSVVMPEESLAQVKERTTAFISAAARALDEVGSRTIQFDKAIVIPPNMPSVVRKLSRETRSLVSDRISADLRLKTWSQI